MTLNHRLAATADCEAVYQLYMDDSANPFLTYDPMPLSGFTPIYASMVAVGDTFVVEAKGEIVATYRFVPKTHRQSHIAYLGGFAVKTNFKGMGIGHMILAHLKIMATEKSFKRIELTVDTENSAAINLHRKVGFEIEGKLRSNYRLSTTGLYYDEYLMALLLG